jgi:Protein of unknown function (DUF3551)
MMNRLLIAATAPAAALIAAIAFGALTAPEASAGEFCRRDVTGHMTGCGFATMEQCQASSAGVGGDCFRDPYLKDNSNANAYYPKSRSRSGSPTAGNAANANQ